MSTPNTPSVTAEMASVIKALLNGTSLTNAQIAAELGAINQGRVSEIRTGKRFSEVPPCSLEEAKQYLKR
ncbi:hypothetical protein ACW9UR_18990 [Halovulum sp. GXIMD14794]